MLKYEGLTNYVRQLDDHVKGGAEAVKFAMDRFGEEFKEWFNNTYLPAWLSTENGNSGADNVGATPILPGADTVQKALEALLTQIQAATIGQIPDGTITDAKLSNQAGQIKSKVTALENNLSEIEGEVDSHKAENATLNQLGHVNHAVLTATLDTSWSGSSAPYTKTISASGILSTDVPFIDIVMSGIYATDTARQEAWGYIYRAVTADNDITFYATDKPTVSLPLQIKVVR